MGVVVQWTIRHFDPRGSSSGKYRNTGLVLQGYLVRGMKYPRIIRTGIPKNGDAKYPMTL